MITIQVRDNKGNLTWVEASPCGKYKINDSAMYSKPASTEQMFKNEPSLISLLNKRPAHLCGEADSFMDTLNFAGVTLGIIVIGIFLFNQSISIDILAPSVFFVMLTLHLFIYKSQEKNELELQKEWINEQNISTNLKARYLKDIDSKKSSVIWVVSRFCLFFTLAIFIVALLSAVFDDKKK